MMQDWVKVYSSAQLTTASMIAGILSENEIPVNLVNKQDSSYVFLGEVEVYVPLAFEAAAKSLIQAHT